MKEIFEKLRPHGFWIIFALIMLVAIFLRTYEFHDWLRFSHDQARDARIVTDALNGTQALPLLGPKAGGTSFLLGPAYYYFSYISGFIFGNYPDKMAYPSLFFAILALPMFYFFMREYFNRWISVSAVAIMSTSYFFVASSRFSSNPHLIPFFLLLGLLAILKILDGRNDKRFFWPAMLGISLGIGIQTHTMFLVIMPIITAGVFAYLFFKQNPAAWKNLLVTIVVATMLNGTQIVSEIRTDGQNIRNFFSGFNEKTTKSSFVKDISWTSVCQVRANAYFLSSFGSNKECEDLLKAPSQKFKKNIAFYARLATDTIISVIGYALLLLTIARESDRRKKNFLGLVIFLNAVALFFFFFVAKFLAISYFIMLFPIPFVMLGLTLQFLEKRFINYGKYLAICLTIILALLGLHRCYQEARDLSRGMGNNSESTTLEAIESISKFILTSAEGHNTIYLTGSKDIVGRFNSPLQYFIQGAGKTMVLSWQINNPIILPGSPLFYIETSSNEIADDRRIGGRDILGGGRFFRQIVLILNN